MLSTGRSQNVLLVNLEYENNPIEDPPQLVLQQGFKSVMGYLQRMFDVSKTGHVDLRDLQVLSLLDLLVPKCKY